MTERYSYYPSMGLKACRHCGGPALLMREGSPQPARFPYQVKCQNTKCGMQTPWCSTGEVVIQIWQKTAPRPAHKVSKKEHVEPLREEDH